jgi:DNA-binding NarL/FixJ family response regulator
MKQITILIADDHKLIRETWSYILNSDPRFQVIAECGDADIAVDLSEIKHPDVILMDIQMTPVSGFELTERILKVSPSSKIIGVTMHSQPSYAKKMFQLGAKGFLTKNSSTDEMIMAILEVSKGNKYLCNEIRNNISELMFEENPKPVNISSLTQREMEIVNLIKKGYSSKDMAEQLHISVKTVEVHRHNILKKLNLKNSASLVNFINNPPM